MYKELLDINPENTTYYIRLAEAEKHTVPSETLHMLQRYEDLFPRALAPRRLQLNYATGVEFKTLVDRYLRRGNFFFTYDYSCEHFSIVYGDIQFVFIFQDFTKAYRRYL